MKIAIITHSLRCNYGGILQNYALQQILKKWGHEVCTLKVKRKRNKWKEISWLLRYYAHKVLGRNAVPPLLNRDINIICKYTDRFVHSHIQMSPPMDLIDKKWIKKQHFDAIIVGSDQVLHPYSYKKIEDVYLGFVRGVRKIIYAGSFGSEKWFYNRRQESECAKCLQDFCAISSRETTGVKFFKDKFHVQAQLVLDPTLLLNQEQYLKFTSKIPLKPCITTYLLDPNEDKKEIIKMVQFFLQKDVESASNENMENPFIDVDKRIANSVEEWLYKMGNADFIITDSYHGTCFAIIFKKQFITIANEKRGVDRFQTLLSSLDLQERLIYASRDLSESLICRKINYDDVYEKLSKFREGSLSFLEEALMN